MLYSLYVNQVILTCFFIEVKRIFEKLKWSETYRPIMCFGKTLSKTIYAISNISTRTWSWKSTKDSWQNKEHFDLVIKNITNPFTNKCKLVFISISALQEQTSFAITKRMICNLKHINTSSRNRGEFHSLKICFSFGSISSWFVALTIATSSAYGTILLT